MKARRAVNRVVVEKRVRARKRGLKLEELPTLADLMREVNRAD